MTSLDLGPLPRYDFPALPIKMWNPFPHCLNITSFETYFGQQNDRSVSLSVLSLGLVKVCTLLFFPGALPWLGEETHGVKMGYPSGSHLETSNPNQPEYQPQTSKWS